LISYVTNTKLVDFNRLIEVISWKLIVEYLSRTEHILSRIYSCTKPSNRSIDNATTEHFTLHISSLQLHKLLSTAR